MAKLNVEIVTPEARVAQLTAETVVAPAADGMIGILPGHSPFLGLLAPGPLTVRSGGKTEAWFVSGGFLEVNEDLVRILPDEVEPLSALDEQAAAARLREAEQRLLALPAGDPGLEAAEAEAQRERARLVTARFRR